MWFFDFGISNIRIEPYGGDEDAFVTFQCGAREVFTSCVACWEFHPIAAALCPAGNNCWSCDSMALEADRNASTLH